MRILTTLKTSAVAIATLCFGMTMSGATIEYNGITYSSSGTNLTVAASAGDPYSGDIVLESPITIDGIEYSVISVGTAFKSNEDITSIYLPDDCITIGRGGFSGCSNLKSARLSPNMVKFGGSDFQNCTSLEEISIPGGITTATGTNFSGCTSLKKITFEDGEDELDMSYGFFGSSALPIEEVVLNRQISTKYTAQSDMPFRGNTNIKKLTVGGHATSVLEIYFENCTGLEDVELASTVTSLGSSAFANTGLTSIEIPAGITSIPSSCFKSCSKLTDVTLLGDVTSIGETAFSGAAVSNINLPESLTSIGTMAFSGCNLQGDIVLPDGLTKIGEQAFADNTAITTLAIGSALTSFGEGAVKGSTGITAFTVDAANTAYKVKDNQALATIDGLTIMAYPPAKADAAFVDDEATEIAAYSFYDAANLTSISLGSCAKFGDYSLSETSVTEMTLNGTIGRYVMQNCTALTALTITNSTELPFGVAAGCTALENFTSTTDFLTIKQDAFNGCTALKSLNLGGLLCIIEADAFKDCGVENITLSAAIPAAMAEGVFTADNSNITVTVPADYVDDYKNAAGWSYLNIVGDESLTATGTDMGMPNGLYYAGRDGLLYCADIDGNITSYDVGGVPHTFQLAQFKNRIYGASAGEKFVYSATGDVDGDGKLFYISQLDGNTFQAVVLDNTDGNAYRDPFGLYIYGDTLYVNDRNVAIRKISADAIALSQDYEDWVENSWLGYYGSEWSYGCIKAGFAITQDEDAKGNAEPLYWVGMKYNGNGIFRFKEGDISSSSPTKPDYSAILNLLNPILTTFEIDEVNNQLYVYIEKASNVTGALYRINLDDINANPNPSDFSVLNPVIIDDSPVHYEGSGDNEHVGISQLSTDENGEYMYWCYNAPESESESYHGVEGSYDPSNPLHQSGIKRIKLGEDQPEVEMVLAGVNGYGVVPVNYADSSGNVKSIVADVAAKRMQVIGNAVTLLEDAVVNVYNIGGMLVKKAATTGIQSVSLSDNVKGIYVVEAVFNDGSREVAKVAVQ